MRLFLIWPDKSQGVINLISALEERGHKVVYWLGYEGSDPDAPAGTIFHSYRDAILAKPANGVGVSDFLPPSPELIAKLYKTESLILTMLNRFMDNQCVDERRHRYYEMLRYWHGVLKKYQPDLIIFSILPHYGYDYLLYELAGLLGIKTLMFLDTRIPGRILYFEDFWKGSEVLQKELSKNKDKSFSVGDLSDDIKKYYQIFSDKNYSLLPPHIQYQKKKYSFFHGILKPSKLTAFIKDGTIFKKGFDYLSRSLKGKNFSDLFKFFVSQLSIIFKSNLKKEYINVQSVPDFSRKFVYVPLNVQPECSTSPQGDMYADQILMIGTLSAALPGDWVIYVKEHPIQWFRFGKEFSSCRYERYYKTISEIPNVKLVPMGTNSYKLINQSQAVATIAGAAGWEAMLRSKPALIFGYPWYKDCPSVLRVSDVESCMAALQKVANGLKIDRQDIINYLKSLEATTIRAYLADSAGQGSGLSKEESIKNITKFILSYI